MYKVFIRENGELYSVIKSFFRYRICEMAYKYTPLEWNKSPLPFLILDNLENAADFARAESQGAEYDKTGKPYQFEVWRVHARTIKHINYIIQPWADYVSDQVNKLWYRILKGESVNRSSCDDLSLYYAPDGTYSCLKVKPVVHIITYVNGEHYHEEVE